MESIESGRAIGPKRPVASASPGHGRRDTFHVLLASSRGKLFRDADFAELNCLDNGPSSMAPSRLAAALLLHAHGRASDAEAKARADFDIRWMVALAIEIGSLPSPIARGRCSASS